MHLENDIICSLLGFVSLRKAELISSSAPEVQDDATRELYSVLVSALQHTVYLRTNYKNNPKLIPPARTTLIPYLYVEVGASLSLLIPFSRTRSYCMLADGTSATWRAG